MRQRLKLELL
ncbi:hypothetical protein Celaphus_00010773 [Cervus elaphus hippelaphus]|uniref:Uncharacterized protein n=1 Tax=Cervus elaphus hippelaphus TaxID=46360 RepID=A0A212CRK9_CEREH|nr:hypothetical protein Celaphus_00010773 [Cervus elaphus hippelaphus]